MNWHLFKGGIRTSIIDQLHNPLVLDQQYKAIEEEKDYKYFQKLKSLEVYKKPEDTNEQSHKRRQSRGEILVEGDKVEIEDEFKPNEEYWTTEVKNLAKDREFLEMVNKKVRELVPYAITYTNEKRRPNFKKEF